MILQRDHDNHLYAEIATGGAPIRVKIIADSITDGGSRLTSWIWEYPRKIHAEIMTHRALSRNLSSSRAIPAKKLREAVLSNPVIPVHWGKNQAGMQATIEVDDTEAAKNWWLEGRDLMAAHHAKGEALGLHKQIVNRVIEPWMQAVALVSSTDHANLFYLRKHKDAEPNFQAIATLAWELYHNHMPTYRAPGSWHATFIKPNEAFKDTNEMLQVSVGRSARVSYMTHEGTRDKSEDIGLHDRLAKTATLGADPMHASPFEHQALAIGGRVRHGNFEGWKQYRKLFAKEAGPDTSSRCEVCGCWEGHVAGCPNA